MSHVTSKKPQPQITTLRIRLWKKSCVVKSLLLEIWHSSSETSNFPNCSQNIISSFARCFILVREENDRLRMFKEKQVLSESFFIHCCNLADWYSFGTTGWSYCDPLGHPTLPSAPSPPASLLHHTMQYCERDYTHLLQYWTLASATDLISLPLGFL